jgi:5-methylcytosine-specific restriction enzyme A
MFEKIKRLLRLNDLSKKEVTALSVPRSGKWRKVRAEHLEINPCCAICGSTHKVVPHHIVPVHVDPSKELDLNNLISLCQGKTFNCHLFFGHLKNWSCWNPNVVEDVEVWNHRFENK